MAIIAPSLLAADFLHLERECAMVNESEAEWLHLDVMDGRFVPNISFGLPVIEMVTGINKKISDVHLMIVEPEKYISAFKTAGAQVLSIHLEACPHLHRNIEQIRSLGMDAGVAVNPHSPIDLLKDILHDIQVVNLMSVNPGFGGQKFIPHTLVKIKLLRRMIDEKGMNVKIQIDGGVTVENAAEIIAAGADVLVVGNTVFKSSDPIATIHRLKQL
ncbi:MAG TPA: ribulose-phosphate 3-epimerase [Flavitalea sp.]|nr:ribulose-phosphate 3-epimerase [Flavitalea sp.]